jgi:hypothetical protein
VSARCGWQPGRLCGLDSPPPLSGGGEVHGADGESMAATSRNGDVVPGGSRCCGERWSSGTTDIHVNGGGGVADVGVSVCTKVVEAVGHELPPGGHGARAAPTCADKKTGGLGRQFCRL